jgi:uncharacterized membrane protein YdjX (TVP38/TMEM64 family)
MVTAGADRENTMAPQTQSMPRIGWMAIGTAGAILLLVMLRPDLASELDPARITRWLARRGDFAPIAYMALMAATVATPLPSLPLNFAAGAYFGPWLGTLYSATGALGGALISFGLARFLGRRFIERFLRGHINFCASCSDRLLTLVIFLTRVVPIVSFDLVSYGAGLTKITPLRYSAATFLGMLPLTFLYNAYGAIFTVNTGVAIGLGVVMVLLFFLVPLWIERHGPVALRGMFSHANPTR